MDNPSNYEQPQDDTPSPDELSVFRESIESAAEQLEGNYPGMPELVKELDHHGLGRAMIIRSEKFKAPPETLEQAFMGMASGGNRPEYDNQLVGYILPLNYEQTSHLVMFNNAHIYILSPANSSREVQSYKEHFAPNEHPLSTYVKDIPSFENHLLYGGWSPHDRDMVVTNKDPQRIDEIRSAIQQAISVAREVKNRQDASVSATADELIREFTLLLNPPKQNTEHQQGE